MSKECWYFPLVDLSYCTWYFCYITSNPGFQVVHKEFSPLIITLFCNNRIIFCFPSIVYLFHEGKKDLMSTNSLVRGQCPISLLRWSPECCSGWIFHFLNKAGQDSSYGVWGEASATVKMSLSPSLPNSVLSDILAAWNSLLGVFIPWEPANTTNQNSSLTPKS